MQGYVLAVSAKQDGLGALGFLRSGSWNERASVMRALRRSVFLGEQKVPAFGAWHRGEQAGIPCSKLPRSFEARVGVVARWEEKEQKQADVVALTHGQGTGGRRGEGCIVRHAWGLGLSETGLGRSCRA